jgi:type I restriction enzyme S subunit
MNQLDEQSSFSKEWKRVRLEDVCCPEKNIVSADSEVGESLPYLSLEHIESLSGRILKESLGQIDSQGVSTTYRFDERYVLYGKLRPYLNKVAMPDFAGRCTTELIPLLPDSDIITKDYLAWILRRDETVHIAMSDVTGSRMPRANMDKLFKMSFPLPPLPEQKQIVEKLNKQLELAEQAKKSAEQKLQAAKKLRESLLDNVFPQPENLPTGWKLTKFGDVCEQETGTYNPSNKSDVNFTYIDISSIDCVTKSIGSPKTLKGKDAPSRARKRIFQNDIILSTTRPNLNAVAIVPKEYDCQVCSTGFCVLRTKPELVNYLFLLKLTD